jgi:hypothetical protein
MKSKKSNISDRYTVSAINTSNFQVRELGLHQNNRAQLKAENIVRLTATPNPIKRACADSKIISQLQLNVVVVSQADVWVVFR